MDDAATWATIALVIITAWYALQTHKISKAARDSANEAARAAEAAERAASITAEQHLDGQLQRFELAFNPLTDELAVRNTSTTATWDRVVISIMNRDEGPIAVLRDSPFPQGLGGIYLQFYKRQFSDIDEYRARYRPALETMCAAREAMPVDELADALGWSRYERVEVLDRFGSLVAVRGGDVHPFHLSALDWVRDHTRAGPYAVLELEGGRRLAEYCWASAQARPDALPVYALRHAVDHLVEDGREHDAAALLVDVRYLRQRTGARLQDLLIDIDRTRQALDDPERIEELEMLASCLRLASDVVMRDPDQLASQLQARLLVHDQPGLRVLVHDAVERADVPVLAAVTPALRQAGHPLTRVLRGLATGDDDEDLFALSLVGLDDTRTRAMAVSESGMLHVWNIHTGLLQEREPLGGEGFGCGALSADGALGRSAAGTAALPWSIRPSRAG